MPPKWWMFCAKSLIDSGIRSSACSGLKAKLPSHAYRSSCVINGRSVPSIVSVCRRSEEIKFSPFILKGLAKTGPNGRLVFWQDQLEEGRGILPMKKKLSIEQIVGVLKQAEVGVPVAELIRKTGITDQTYYRWKAEYVGLEVDQIR